MILTGHIDSRNRLWVNLTVSGSSNEIKTKAQIDTGFTGELVLPLSIAVPLGLTLAGAANYELADGSLKASMLFSASISWGTAKKEVTTTVLDTDVPLLGGGLLHGYTLIADFENKSLIIKEPSVDEPSISDNNNDIVKT